MKFSSFYIKTYKGKIPNTEVSLDKKISTSSLLKKVRNEDAKKNLLLLNTSDAYFWDFGVRASEHLNQGDMVGIFCVNCIYFGKISRIIKDKSGCIGDSIGWKRLYDSPWKNVFVFDEIDKIDGLSQQKIDFIDAYLDRKNTEELCNNFFLIKNHENIISEFNLNIHKDKIINRINVQTENIDNSSKTIFNLIKEDFLVIDIAKKTAKILLNNENNSSSQIINIIQAIHALEILPHVSQGVYSEFGLTYRVGSEDFNLTKHIEFRITDSDFELSRNKIIHDSVNGSRNICQPGWFFNIQGEGSFEYNLHLLEDEIIEDLNNGAQTIIVENNESSANTSGWILRKFFNYIDARLQRKKNELKNLQSSSRHLLKTERTECEVIRSSYLDFFVNKKL